MSPSDGEEAIRKILSMIYHSSSEKPIESSSEEAHAYDTIITFIIMIFYLVKHYTMSFLYGGHVLDKKINRILIVKDLESTFCLSTR